MKRIALALALFIALACSTTPAMARHYRYYPYWGYGYPAYGYPAYGYGYVGPRYYAPAYGYGYGGGPIFDARAFGFSTFGF